MSDKKKLLILFLGLLIIIVGATIIVNNKTKNVVSVNTSAEENVKKTSFVLDVNEENFETEVKNSDKKVLIDFYADWCGPCNRLVPLVDKVAEENQNVKVVRIDVDQNENLMNQYNVHSIPTLIVVENGEEVRRSVGLIPEESIVNLIGDWLFRLLK